MTTKTLFDTAKNLYNYLGIEFSDESVREDLRHGYLTINTGSDGADYYYYFDGVQECYASADSCAVISDMETIKRLFPWFY